MRQLDRKEWPYQKQITFDKPANTKIQWAEVYMKGRHKDEWTWVSISPMLVFCFKREQDYMMFCLRWT